LSAKPLIAFGCAGLLLGGALLPQAARAADPVTLVLFPRTLTNNDDVRALVDVRKKLRTDGTYAVITYDPNSSAVKRAASENHHPEWLTDPMGNDPERLALTRALGASFAVIIARADSRGKMDVRVDEAVASARTWNGYDEKPDDAARFIRQQAAFALANLASGPVAPPRPGVVSVPTSVPPVPVPARVSAPSAPAFVPTPAPPAAVSAPMPTSPASAVAPSPIIPAPVAAPIPAPVLLAPVVAPAPNSVPAPLAQPLPAAVPFPAPLVSAPPVPIAVPALVMPAPASVPAATRPTVPARTSAPAAAPHVSTPVPVPAMPVSRVPRVVRPVPAPRVFVSVAAKPAPPVSAAVVPSSQSKSDQTLIVPSPLPIPAPSQVVIVPGSSVAPSPVPRSDEDLVSVRAVISQGDDALSAGNFVAAISAYRDAVNGAPLAMMPRLKLAQAYLQSDRRDKALSEAQRALQIAPNDMAVQQFLVQLDAETGSSDGAVTRFQALVAQTPQDPAAHLELADALWNNGALSQAEGEYQTAQALAGPRAPAAQQAAAHLARLYAAQSRYADSLAALKHAGAGGYALALGIVQSRADTLRSMLDSGLESMNAGKTTHEAFYKTASDAAAQAQALADFVVKVSPPSAFGVSHLHRVLATHLMAQQAAVLVNYVETSDASFAGQAARLEKEALTEMLTAHAAEQKLGLWEVSHAEARD